MQGHTKKVSQINKLCNQLHNTKLTCTKWNEIINPFPDIPLEPIMTQVLTLDQCPESVQAYFLSMPGFQQAMKITKATSVDTPAQVVKTLKTSRPQHIKKSAPSFASILRGSPAHKAESAALKAISSAPSKPVAPGMSLFKPADPAAPAKALPKAHNAPKTPIPSKGAPVNFQDLRSAIDTALHERAQREQAERFNAGRSAFARLTPSKESDAPRGGMGDAWSLRNASGKLVQAVLGVRKGVSNTMPAGSMRPVTGASLKG